MGRPTGSQNKPRRALIALLEENFPGYNPVIEMARIASNEDTEISIRLAAHKEVAQYIMPKLRAIEVQMEGAVDATIRWGDSHSLQSETPTGTAT